VPLPVQAGGRCSHGPVSPSDVCGHRLHRFLQGLEPGPLLGKAARRATSLSEAVRPLSIISALPSLANRLLPPASSYRLGGPLAPLTQPVILMAPYPLIPWWRWSLYDAAFKCVHPLIKYKASTLYVSPLHCFRLYCIWSLQGTSAVHWSLKIAVTICGTFCLYQNLG